ncbi:MAG: hypothetical protein CFH32_00366 [Alphaproteobacteria bacterium MarineAlpha9_Bin2]|nr:MAG: hypothetical protein CFH32_00366 [Alphaproteobacteria bacterium MarineAlpha9_Bin2]
MGKILNNEEIDNYNKNGFFFPLRVMSEEEASYYRDKLEEYEENLGKPISGNERHKAHLLFTWIDTLVRHPLILDAIEDIIGPNILCWSSNFFIKEANDKSFVTWHQDATYWGLDPENVITAWIALSDASIKTGPMEVIPKSHKWDTESHTQTNNSYNLLSRGQELNKNISKEKIVYMPLNAGEISLHHIKLAHSSKPNKTNDRRIGLAIRYIKPDVKNINTNDSALLVRGVDKFKHYELEISPNEDLSDQAVLNHKKYSDIHVRNLMRE